MAKQTATLSIEERRARRAARREKQRQANAGRAAKMHAARIAQVTDLTGQDESPPRLNVGCSGWFYWGWKDRFYPRDMPTKQWFDHYAGEFQTVELNSPFYSWPTVATVKSWVRQTKDRPLIYTVKVCELITHVKKFTRTKQLIRDFGFIADLLGPHMGCFLFQLPPSFNYTPARLKRILEQLDPRRRNVVEFRHRSWWNEKVVAAFRKTNTIFCSCSAPRLPDELVKTTDEVYIRFHGTKQWYRHHYTEEELAAWATRIHKSKPRRVWAYFNNDYEANAVKNARELLGLLRAMDQSADTER
jgi:uncharacterized protein YecE (DUF72 family)